MPPYETDERLKSRLDTNQLVREQLCRAVLALDKRFSDVRPRHPRGGRDGGRDLDAIFGEGQVAFGAVGFVNQANDSAAQKKTIAKKFSEDLAAALAAQPKPSVFAFFTNINLTVGEKDKFKEQAQREGFAVCEIFDRERIRIALDDTNGLAARFQYLEIPLSEAEQASFFAKWGDDIQSVVATGFQRVEGTLDRLVFLNEASDVLDGIYVHFELDREYSAEEIGHFRCFCSAYLREPKYGILGLLFGSSDLSQRFQNNETRERVQRPGIAHGISGIAWEEHIDLPEELGGGGASAKTQDDQEDNPIRRVPAKISSSVGMDVIRTVSATYSHDDPLFRFRPRLRLRDIDELGWLCMLNKSLADKVVGIHIYANQYKLDEQRAGSFCIDSSAYDPPGPEYFSAAELADPWVRIRPKVASVFQLRFSEQTPARVVQARRLQPTLPPRSGDV
jgi:hypothetical protein